MRKPCNVCQKSTANQKGVCTGCLNEEQNTNYRKISPVVTSSYNSRLFNAAMVNQKVMYNHPDIKSPDENLPG